MRENSRVGYFSKFSTRGIKRMNTEQSLRESEEPSERVERKQKVEFVLFASSNERIKIQTKCSKE